MFVVLRKKVIRKYFLAATLMILLGQIILSIPEAQASEITPTTVSAEELRAIGFTDNDLKGMGFINGLGKVIIYNAKQKQIWNTRVEQARERVEIAKRTGKKINPKDSYLLERDNEIKNPPKKPMKEKLFGKFGVQVMDYFKKDGDTNSSAKILGEGLSLGGLLFLLKALAPLAI